MSPQSHIASLVRKAQSNFFYAFLFLPRAKREAIYAAYAFSRHTDDIVDDAASPEEAREQLQAWRSELQSCYNGSPTHPIACNLQRVLRQFPIPQEYFLLLIDGVQMDLDRRRYAAFSELYEYCYRVASAVGLICIEIFGYRNPSTRDYAINLGIALQLTNILRDIGTDAARDRIYLPAEDLNRFGYSEEDLLAGAYTPAFVDLMAFQSSRAWDYYARARANLTREDRPALFSAEAMGRIYALLLRQIEVRRYNVFSRPVRVSNLRKFSIALGTYLRSHL